MSKKFKPVLGKLIFKELFLTLILSLIFIIAGIIILTLTPQINSELANSEISIPSISYLAYVFFFIAFVSIVMSVFKIISFKSINYEISTTFIKKTKDLFSIEKITIPLEQITNIQYTRSWIIDKIFNTGNVYLHTAGSASYDLRLDAVKHPQKMYEYINKLLHYEKSENINERGEFISTKTSKVQKRLKPIPIFPTLGALIGGPFFLIIAGFAGGFVSLITSLFTSNNIFTIIFGTLTILGLITFWIGGTIVTYMSYKRRYYDFYKNKIEFYDGFLTKRKATVATERITNIDNTQGLWGRIFNIHKIQIETAGSSGAEISINYIKNGDEVVEELKEVLKEHGRN